MEKTQLIFRKMVELIKDKKNIKKYSTGPKLHKQVVNKAFLITKILY